MLFLLYLQLLLACLFFAAAPAAEALPERVKVNLFSTEHCLKRIFIYGPAKILEPRSQILGSGLFVVDTTGGGVTLRATSGHRQAVVAHAPHIVIAGTGESDNLLKLANYTGVSPRFYHGKVTLQSAALSTAPGQMAGGNLLSVVNDVDCHSYIASCVGSETSRLFGLEALKAQAVLTTTLLEKSYRGKPINDNTEFQAYFGASGERPLVLQAVKSVFGQELCYDGRPIDVFFSSSCGGTTATPEVFGGPVKAGRYPYLKQINCNFCTDSPFYRDHREGISADAFLRGTGMREPKVLAEDHGRPTKVSFEINGHTTAINGYQFWLAVGQHFGWGIVPSTKFRIEGNPSGRAKEIEFVSRGCGHGVGMCQWGAAGQAKAGRGYKEILYFYFPGTTLKTIAGRHFAVVPASSGGGAKVAGGHLGYYCLACL